MGFVRIACMENRKDRDKSIFHPVKLLNTLFLQESNAQKHHRIFRNQNKGFINHSFCRNGAVRNPTGTRLESSLVNEQVDTGVVQHYYTALD